MGWGGASSFGVWLAVVCELEEVHPMGQTCGGTVPRDASTGSLGEKTKGPNQAKLAIGVVIDDQALTVSSCLTSRRRSSLRRTSRYAVSSGSVDRMGEGSTCYAR